MWNTFVEQPLVLDYYGFEALRRRERVIPGVAGRLFAEYRGGVAVVNGVEIDLGSLPDEEGRDCNDLYLYVDGRWVRLSIAGEHYYRLCRSSPGWAPTLEINGIVMHSKLEDPIKLSRRKTRHARGFVLDCCTGLGYTAMTAAERARRVLTVEVDWNVLVLARLNPVSRGLFADPRIDIVVGDIFDVVRGLRDESVNYVVHDPPRLSHSTQRLYSEELYAEYYRVLKRGGGMFHYTGATGSRYRGLRVWAGVASRLRRVGFRVVRVVEGFGVYAVKD